MVNGFGSGGLSIGAVDLDSHRLEALVFFCRAGKQECAGGSCLALNDLGDDVDAAKPMGLLEVRCGPVRGMAGVRVIKAGDLKSTAAGFMRDFDQLSGGDLVAIAPRIGVGIGCANQEIDLPAFGGDAAEQRAATLVGESFFCVCAKLAVNRIRQAQEAHRIVDQRRSSE